ncbi:MAG: hypothetical protein IT376_17000 [Polyangiaceae bacterium]|nr:hypothetical protein [Polyangiaceae bacterium]
MRGRAHQLVSEFLAAYNGTDRSFVLSRLILRARLVPETILPELDDPAVEARLEAAIRELAASRRPTSRRPPGLPCLAADDPDPWDA